MCYANVISFHKYGGFPSKIKQGLIISHVLFINKITLRYNILYIKITKI
jgi:hypothetical protein